MGIRLGRRFEKGKDGGRWNCRFDLLLKGWPGGIRFFACPCRSVVISLSYSRELEKMLHIGSRKRSPSGLQNKFCRH